MEQYVYGDWSHLNGRPEDALIKARGQMSCRRPVAQRRPGTAIRAKRNSGDRRTRYKIGAGIEHTPSSPIDRLGPRRACGRWVSHAVTWRDDPYAVAETEFARNRFRTASTNRNELQAAGRIAAYGRADRPTAVMIADSVRIEYLQKSRWPQFQESEYETTLCWSRKTKAGCSSAIAMMVVSD